MGAAALQLTTTAGDDAESTIVIFWLVVNPLALTVTVAVPGPTPARWPLEEMVKTVESEEDQTGLVAAILAPADMPTVADNCICVRLL